MIKKIDRALLGFTTTVSLVSYVGFLAVMLIIVVDVLQRKITGTGINGAYELVERILMCGVFAAFAYTQSLRGHVHVTMFISKLPSKPRFLVFGLTGILSSMGAFALAYAAVLQAQYSMSAGTMTGVLQIALYPFFFIEAICMAIFGLTLLWDVCKSFIAIGNKDVAEDIESSWC